MPVKHVTYQQVDKAKWDTCINSAGNGLVYAYSFYLDAMAKNWDALVLDDYEAVMPLTWNKKYGVSYLYQPPFTACLGVFGNNITAETVNEFLEAVPQTFRYWDIYLNQGNLYRLAAFDLYERMNYVLPLNKGYEEIYNNYRDNLKRNIKKSEQFGLVPHKNIPAEEVISLAKEQARNFSDVTAEDYQNFTSLYHLLYQKEKATAYGIYSKERQLLAGAVFFFSHNRAYYILVGNHPNGKTLGASHALINAFIKDHACMDMILDFEGSDISSLAHFYSSFGAHEEKYPGIRLNRLPKALKWLKK